jgi:hypothetical protein
MQAYEFSCRLKERALNLIQYHQSTFGLDIPSHYPNTTSKEVLAFAIFKATSRGRNDLISELSNFLKIFLLPEDHFEWINEDNARLCIWMELRLARLGIRSPKIYNTPTKERRSSVIFNIDSYECPLLDKKNMLEDSRKDWSKLTSLDKHLKWISRKDETQCWWLWDQLMKKQIALLDLAPTNLKEIYPSILASFDNMPDQHPAAKREIFQKLRQAWNQHKRRSAQNDIQQYNFELKVSSKEKLDTISSRQGCSRNKMLELLIESEFNRITDQQSV